MFRNPAIPSYSGRESRRDSITQPRVARHELPWVCVHKTNLQPRRGCIFRSLAPARRDATLSGLSPFLRRTQGSSRTRNPGLLDGIPLGFFCLRFCCGIATLGSRMASKGKDAAKE